MVGDQATRAWTPLYGADGPRCMYCDRQRGSRLHCDTRGEREVCLKYAPEGMAETHSPDKGEGCQKCAGGSPCLPHHEAASPGGPLKIFSLKRKSIPKVAVLATALAVGFMAATVDMRPAQANPSNPGSPNCTQCHTLGGSVTATPSSATMAPGAS